MSDGMSRRAYGRSRWAAAWLDALTEMPGTAAMDLVKGRAYAREGRVGRLRIEPGVVSAWVQGDERAQPYPAVLTALVLADHAWTRILSALRAQAGHLAALLDGEPPAGLGADKLILPGPGELRAVCTCPRRERQPCRHTAAVCYEMAAEIDADPFALLLFRGRPKEQVLDALREDRAPTVHLPTAPGRLATTAYRTPPAPLPPLPPLPPKPDDAHAFTTASMPEPPAVSGVMSAELTDLARRAARTAWALLTDS